MLVKSFFLNESMVLKPIDLQNIQEMCFVSDARVWVDLQYSGLAGLEEWLYRLGVKGLMLRFCVEARDRTGLYPLNNELLLVIPVRIFTGDTDTILSAIFMPSTLMAGIWGMNFEFMPELKLSFAYPVAPGLMAALGAGMFCFFRKKDWFK